MAGAWIVGVLTTGWAALATVALLYPGFGTATRTRRCPRASRTQRGAFEVSQFVPLAVLIALGLLFYVLGAPTRRQGRRREARRHPGAAARDGVTCPVI